MILFFIGYMGSGKTTIGQALARRWGLPFTDLDLYIEQRYGHSISDIFTQEGEAAFRQKEAEALRALPLRRPGIVACGGGCFCDPTNRTYIQSRGIAIYLKVDSAVLCDRLLDTDRPLLHGHAQHRPDLLSFIQQHLTLREVHYRQADMVVKANRPTAEVVGEMAHYFQPYLALKDKSSFPKI